MGHVLAAAAALALLACTLAHDSSRPSWAKADPDRRYAQVAPADRDWIRGLSDRHGFNCCDMADGTRLEDPDWEFDGEGYRVRVDGDWLAVPPEAVVTQNNRVGFAIVWRYRDVDGAIRIRCFLPGAAT